MTYQDIYTTVQNIRFDLSFVTGLGTGGIKDWVKAREEEVWMYAPWPLKQSGAYTVTISGSGFPLPAAFTEYTAAMELYNALGDKLEYMDTDELEQLVASYGTTTPSGGPQFWTIEQTSSGGVVTAAVKMDQADNGASYKVRGWSGPICRSSSSAYKLGVMSATTDLPWWDVNHYFLVSGAVALGKRHHGDPSWQEDEQDFQAGLQRLEDTIIGTRTPLTQWGGNCGEQPTLPY